MNWITIIWSMITSAMLAIAGAYLVMPELDGLEMQRRLTRDGVRLLIVFLTGHGDIPTSVRARQLVSSSN